MNQDQTQFIETQESLQAPPKEQLTPKDFIVLKQKKKRKFKIILIILALVLVVVALLMIASRSPIEETLIKKPTPPPTPAPRELSPMEQKLKDLEELVKLSDPKTIELPSPPVSMDISLEIDN